MTDVLAALGAHDAATAFAKAFWVTIMSEIGDKTFFLAAVLAIKHSRLHIWAGASTALGAMTALSTAMGWAAPQLISKTLTHWAAVALFLYFGASAVREFVSGDSGEDELAEAEKELTELEKARAGKKAAGKAGKASSTLGPIITAFTLTFAAEWGDRSQITTIGLAANENPYGVGLGGYAAHALCSGLAVLGGRHLSQYVNERYLHLFGGLLFLIFAVTAIIAGPNA